MVCNDIPHSCAWVVRPDGSLFRNASNALREDNSPFIGKETTECSAQMRLSAGLSSWPCAIGYGHERTEHVAAGPGPCVAQSGPRSRRH